MTGLDVDSDVIVEIACIVTDSELNARRRRHRPRRARQADATSAQMDDFVRNMHTKSGLLTEIPAATHRRRRRRSTPCSTTSSSTSPSRSRRRCAATASASTAGSSPATCPSSTSTCTTGASTCRRSRSCAGAGIPPSTASGRAKAEQHRALDDIRESIEELRYYRADDARRRRARGRTRDRATHRSSDPAQPRSTQSVSRSSPRAPSSVVTERSRALWPMRPMRQPLPASVAEPAADLDVEAVAQLGAHLARRRHRRAATPT